MDNEELQQFWPLPLPRELSDYILSFVPRQDLACNVRLSCKETAWYFCNSDPYKTVSVSKPVPVQTFDACFGSRYAVSRLPFSRRDKLLELTAGTGQLDNVQALVERAGLPVTANVMASAAAEGHLPVCQWLHGQGCPWRSGDDEPEPRWSASPLERLRYSEDSDAPYPAMRAAAQGGHLELCQWLREAGCRAESYQILCWAAAGGHIDVCKWALSLGNPWADDSDDSEEDEEDYGNYPDTVGFHEAVAGGHRALCDFMLQSGCSSLYVGPALALAGGHTELYEWLMQLYEGDPDLHGVNWEELAGGAAVGADLATLQRLVAVVREQEGPAWSLTQSMCVVDVGTMVCSPTPDAAAKVRWLQEAAGVDFLAEGVLSEAAEFARPDVVGVLWELLAQAELREAAQGAAVAAPAAAAGGLQQQEPQQQQAVGGAGVRKAGVLDVTAKYGKLREVLVDRAARSGRVEVLEVLQGAGWVPTVYIAEDAASKGHEGAVAWLVERVAHQCKTYERVVDAAAVSGNTALVRQLWAAGWALGEDVVCFAVMEGNGELLEWLVEQGFPVEVSAIGARMAAGGVLRRHPAMSCCGSSRGPPGSATPLAPCCLRPVVNPSYLCTPIAK